MPLEEVVNEHFLARYRALLDAEDAAFDELEHAYEDGDREHFATDLATWCQALAPAPGQATGMLPFNSTPARWR